MTQRCSVQLVVDILHAKVGVPLDIPNIDTTSWEDMSVESLGLTEVCASLEHQLNIPIPSEDIFATHNIQGLVAFVNSIQA